MTWPNIGICSSSIFYEWQKDGNNMSDNQSTCYTCNVKILWLPWEKDNFVCPPWNDINFSNNQLWQEILWIGHYPDYSM